LPHPLFVAVAVGTVTPRVTDEDGPRWELELSELGLDTFVLEHSLFNSEELLVVSTRVAGRSQTDVVLHSLCGQIHHGLVEFVLANVLAKTIRGRTLIAIQSS
jgi:hypothetical protein